MAKEQIIEKLEEVFDKACKDYNEKRMGSLKEIRELAETIIHAKRDVAHEVKQAEKFIEHKIQTNVSLSEKDIARIAEELKKHGASFV